MARLLGGLAVVLLAALPVTAGELDRDFAKSAPPTNAVTPATADPTFDNWTPGELDAENPTQACGWRRGFGFGFGYNPVG